MTLNGPRMTTIEFEEERLAIFPTLVSRRVFTGLEELNEALRRLALRRAETEPSVVRSNFGGYHSDADLFRSTEPPVVVLTELLRTALLAHLERELGGSVAAQFHLEGWFNVSRRGDFHRPHVHPSTTYAAVYYVDPGDASPEERHRSGVLEFLDPRNRPHMVQRPGAPVSDSFALVPRASELILFPGFLYHYVTPYLGERPRISVAVNAMLLEAKR